MNKRHIAILGSTGSIGTQALDVISQHPDLFEVELLTANNNSSLLIEQALKFKPNAVVICNKELYSTVFEALDKEDIKVFAGIESANELVKGSNIDIVLAAMVGFSGLEPTINAVKSGKVIALANKETLVAAGSIITKLAKEHNSPILPVDSEHSAIFQCLQGESAQIEKLLLTASGGPFLNTDIQSIMNATRHQALKHPNWSMGAKVTIDSASMMNKGLEMIEASWLFNMEPDKIEIVVHPQSIVHSLVQFTDGSLKAQLGAPDMRVPIQYALSYPHRIALDTKRISLAELGQLTFSAPDRKKFPAIDLAYSAHRQGGNMACIMNGANEVAVAALLEEKILFGKIPHIIEKTMQKCSFIAEPSISDIFETDACAKAIAREFI
ncbi:MAG: 1-deoxy-D-xylulose-5-phosphate reductoisomerase [Bacteroidales bacterium]|nr:1-deoxy-D-xylulose-5-phosphate reductoisomerase [Bacteroidales bacterium]MBQ7997897.1 1-deoxy-D-xylulose-5-phosphate reductoisomerase [Bacteroidales bacterium]MBQ8033960.1 1-deoxy-D-xylulose-5-phosphate reductoisomerase [Bacteroidales bacterium]MBR4095621.1 1-deoxy-D-xylulose-5-phosphate reductoisomerase [Bacteroidales bacterium]